MGISLDGKLRIAGYRPATFKNGLAALMQNPNAGAVIDRKTIFPLRRDGAIFLEECIDRNLVDPSSYKPNDSGEALARAKARKRSPLIEADRVLEEFLQRVEALNSDAEAIGRVSEIWLFGSLLRRHPDVGDIDMAVSRSWNPRFSKDHAARRAQADLLVKNYPDAPTSWATPWSKEGWLTNRALYGRSRHRLLAPQSGPSDLASLGVPCRLIYDLDRGGRVDDPILDRHPTSTGRHNTVDPPAEMPDLSPAPLRPMDGRWVTAFDPWGDVSPYCMFRGWTNDAHRLFPDFPRELRVFADGHDAQKLTWRPKLLKDASIDGRSSLVITNTCGRTSVALALNRQIETTPEAWTLRASFGPMEVARNLKRVDFGVLIHIAAVTTLILAVDAERMLRRKFETDETAAVQISINFEETDCDVASCLSDWVKSNLIERITFIEPAGLIANPVNIL